MTTITKEKKIEIVEELRSNIAKQKGIFFVNFKGIKGSDSRALRGELQKGGAKMVVARKTLIKIAFEKEGIDFNPLLLNGEAGFIFGFEDGIGAAKIARKFDKESLLTLLGGIYEGNVLTAEEVKSIAELPSKNELLAMLLGSVSAPMSGFLQVLQGNIKGLLQVLSSIKKENN
jgi:large subunit ribosomal protein L10